MASRPEIREEIVRQLEWQGSAIYAATWDELHQRLCPSVSLRQFKLAFNSLVYNKERRQIVLRRLGLVELYHEPRSIFARLVSS